MRRSGLWQRGQLGLSRFGVAAGLLVAGLLASVACGGGGAQESSSSMSTASSTASSTAPSSVSSEDSPPLAAPPKDLSGEWWYRTFGDEAVLLANSELAVIRKPEDLGRDQDLAAYFRAREGVTSLEIQWDRAEGGLEETLELPSEDYLALWRAVIESGFIGAAMGGSAPSWEPAVELYLHGAAGPQELGWSVSSTRTSFEDHEISRRLLEILEDAAAQRSEIYREAR